QLKAKFAEVVARKEPQPAPTPPADSKDRIAAIFRRVQSDSTKRTASDSRPQSTGAATDRIASIMRKGLQPGQINPSNPPPNAKPAAPSAPPPDRFAREAVAAAPQNVSALFDTAPTPAPQAPSKVAGKIIEWLKSEISNDPDLNHVTVLTVIG